jgi:hypothetical protein
MSSRLSGGSTRWKGYQEGGVDILGGFEHFYTYSKCISFEPKQVELVSVPLPSIPMYDACPSKSLGISEVIVLPDLLNTRKTR